MHRSCSDYECSTRDDRYNGDSQGRTGASEQNRAVFTEKAQRSSSMDSFFKPHIHALDEEINDLGVREHELHLRKHRS